MINRFERIYVNGCSLTAGHGLDTEQVKTAYNEKYGVPKWKHEKDITYPQYVANHFGVPVFNDAQSGSGIIRLVRRTFEYVQKIGLNEAKKTLFLLQPNGSYNRLELYDKETEDYLIVNPQYDDDGSLKSVAIVDTWSKTDTKKPHQYYKHVEEDFKEMYKKYIDPFASQEKYKHEFLGLIHFFIVHNIEFFIFPEYEALQNMTNFHEYYIEHIRPRVIVLEDRFRTVGDFSTYYGGTLNKEFDFFGEDTHPGYFGHKMYAEALIPILEEKLRGTIWVFGDSFSESYVNQANRNHVEFQKYIEFKGGQVKTYPDFLSEMLGYKLENLSFGGASNYSILNQFTSVMHRIKPNDVIVVGWTSTNRFRMVDDNGEFVNVIFQEFNQDAYPNIENVTKNSINEIVLNRINDRFYEELIEFTKVVDNISKDCSVVHWSWSNPPFPKQYEYEFIKRCIKFKKPDISTIKHETKGLIDDNHYNENTHLLLAEQMKHSIMTQINVKQPPLNLL